MTERTISVATLETRLRMLGAKESDLRQKHLADMERNKGKDELYWGFRIMAAICLGKLNAYNELLEQLEKSEL